MPQVTFFRQARIDGGVRTGVDVDRSTVLMRYEPGTDEHDPSLKWYVDVRCDGPALPTEGEEARQWLVEHAVLIKDELLCAGRHLELGFDSEARPFERRVESPPADTTILIVASAQRRVMGRDMASTLQSLADDWEASLHNLEPLARV